MFNANNEDQTVELNWGNKGSISVSFKSGPISAENKLYFRMYYPERMTEEPVFEKEIKVEEETDLVVIELTGKEMEIGAPLATGKKEYWYTLTLGEDNTLVGYDGDGPRKVIIYPKGAKKNGEQQ